MAPARKAHATSAQRRAAIKARIAMAVGVRGAERRFVTDLRGIMRGVHAAFMSYLEPAMRATAGAKADAKIPDHAPRASGNAARDVDAVLRAVLPQIGPRVAAAHKRMSSTSMRIYASTMQHVLPIKWEGMAPAVQMAAGVARNNSIALVENAGREYAAGVRKVFGDPQWTQGRRWEDLRDALLERGDVSESRAELIARDQTLKLNGAINQATQQSVGVTAYVWSTSGDERVRDTHAELDGQTFSWMGPPEPGHPGEDYQCRCIALPIIGDFAELGPVIGARSDTPAGEN